MMEDQMSDELSLAGILRYLPEDFDRQRIQFFPLIDSTNTEAKRQATEGAPDGTVLVAAQQTAGRGRVGRSFYSPRFGGIYFSILLRPKLLMQDMVRITACASIAVADAIFAVTGVYPQIKWVNDLYFSGKKVCGILTELVSAPSHAVVVGVGVNCSAVFPKELQEIAGNLPEVEDMKNRLAAELTMRLSSLEEMIVKGDFLSKYRKHSMVIGQYVTLLQEEGSRYFAKGIGDNCELILEDENGQERRLSTGEISIRFAAND